MYRYHFMSVSKAQLFSYELPLLEAFPRHLPTDLRSRGFIVVLHSDDQQIGYGEVAEASLVSSESLGDSFIQLCSVPNQSYSSEKVEPRAA